MTYQKSNKMLITLTPVITVMIFLSVYGFIETDSHENMTGKCGAIYDNLLGIAILSFFTAILFIYAKTEHRDFPIVHVTLLAGITLFFFLIWSFKIYFRENSKECKELIEESSLRRLQGVYIVLYPSCYLYTAVWFLYWRK